MWGPVVRRKKTWVKKIECMGAVWAKLEYWVWCGQEGVSTRWGLRSSNSLGVITIQTIDIFIRGCYLQYANFLSQDIRFWLGLKSAISSQAWAHQAAGMKAKLRIYPGTLPFELQHSLNQVKGWRKVELLGFRNRGLGMVLFMNVMNNVWEIPSGNVFKTSSRYVFNTCRSDVFKTSSA